MKKSSLLKIGAISTFAVLFLAINFVRPWILHKHEANAAMRIEQLGGNVAWHEKIELTWYERFKGLIFGSKVNNHVCSAIFYNCEELEDEDLQHLSAFQELEFLSIRESPKIDGSGLAFVRSNKLRILSISRTNMNDKNASQIGRFHSLEDLRLTDSTLTGEFLASLDQLKELRSMQIESPNLGQHMLLLREFESLEELEIVSNSNEQNLTFQVQDLPQNLETLRLFSDRINYVWLIDLYAKRNLVHLTVSSDGISEVAAYRLSEISSLRSLAVYGAYVPNNFNECFWKIRPDVAMHRCIRLGQTDTAQ